MLWQTAMSGNEEVGQIVNYAHNNNARTAYIVTSKSPGYTRRMSEYFRRAARLAGVKIIGTGNVSLGGGGAVAVARAIAHKQPNVVFTPLFSPYVQPIVAKLRDNGVRQPIYATDGMDAATVPKRFAVPLQGVYYGSFGFARPTAQAFSDDYKAAYGKPPPGSFPGLGYEAIRIIAAAAARTDSVAPRAIGAVFSSGLRVTGVALGDVAYLRGSKDPATNAAMSRVVFGKPWAMFSSNPQETLKIPAP
jgi:ABC-type branched-subunit amino acid transport system substrate-binding protein